MSFSLTYRRLAFIWSNTKKSAEFELRLNILQIGKLQMFPTTERIFNLKQR
jgi:hypothetical protein